MLYSLAHPACLPCLISSRQSVSNTAYAYGSLPRKPNSRRSSCVNALPLFHVGLLSNSAPLRLSLVLWSVMLSTSSALRDSISDVSSITVSRMGTVTSEYRSRHAKNRFCIRMLGFYKSSLITIRTRVSPILSCVQNHHKCSQYHLRCLIGCRLKVYCRKAMLVSPTPPR